MDAQVLGREGVREFQRHRRATSTITIALFLSIDFSGDGRGRERVELALDFLRDLLGQRSKW